MNFWDRLEQPQTAGAITAADPLTIANCAGNPECFAFSIDTRLDATGGLTNTGSVTFAIPTSGVVGNTSNAYSWIVNWGDGNTQNVSGTSSNTTAPGVNGISHTYAAAGPYQITIRPNGAATTGWFNAFGFSNNTTGANADANKYMFRSIDTPFTNLMRAQSSTYRFAYVFQGAVNGTGIPDNLFANVSTAGVTDFTYMFSSTFGYFAQNSTTAAIPASLFSSFDTSSGLNFNGMFYNTFILCAQNSTAATIPAGLLDSINTSSGTNFYNMFRGTFNSYAQYSTVGTIPEGLFDSINTINGNDFTQMLSVTFTNYANSSTVGTIPPDLFQSINTSNGTIFTNMYVGIFQYYAQRTASFVVGGSTVNTQTFFSGDTDTNGLYSTKIGAAGTPSVNPTVNATTGSQVVPTYDATIRTIIAPGGAYANYTWYRTDGTSCAVATPTPDCGIQNASSLVTFPDSNEWIPTTPTTTDSVTFYAFNSSVPDCVGTPECFAFTVDTRLDSTGATSTSNATFAIPTSGYVNGVSNYAYNWTINFGGAGVAPAGCTATSNPNEYNCTGTSGTGSNGIAYTYATAGQYQIIIRPNAAPAAGWFNAFGFYTGTTGTANVQANKDLFKSIDTPFSDLMRTKGNTYRFANVFYGARNGAEIPENLFVNITTDGSTNLSSMFNSTFNNYAYNSTTATIPGNLFDSLNTSSATNISSMFANAFNGYAYKSTAATIPADLFDFLSTPTSNTSSVTNFGYMFQSALRLYTFNNPTATIPSGLFNFDTSGGTVFEYMFNGAFNMTPPSGETSYYKSTVATIPADLFTFLDTSMGTNLTFLFNSVFSAYAYNSNTTIPAGLFDSISIGSNVAVGIVNFGNMFGYAFNKFAYNSNVGTIPADLFDFFGAPGNKTGQSNSFGSLFYYTFAEYAINSTNGTIPSGLFSAIDSGGGTSFSSTFAYTFQYYARNSTAGTIPADLFSSLDTSRGTSFQAMFNSTFNYYAYNSSTTIPAGLFDSIVTTARPLTATPFQSMFSNTFSNFAYVSTGGTIPAGLFDSLATDTALDFNSMFNGTFSSYARNSTVGTIPAGLFAKLNTSSGQNFNAMFSSTFANYAYNNTTGNIPAGLFGSINTGSGTIFSSMFLTTFSSFARVSTVGDIPAGLFSTINTSGGTTFQSMFSGTFNGYANSSTVGDIPAGLFSSIDTSYGTGTGNGVGVNFSSMFSSAFANYAQYSTVGNIPVGLFSAVDTTKGNNLSGMFNSTFQYFATRSTTATIPTGLFDGINTANCTNFGSTFYSTFSGYAGNSTVATIPAGLFDSLNTALGQNFSQMFQSTFYNYGQYSTVGTVPSDLFYTVTTPNGTVFTNMFNTTFSGYARRAATFMVSGSVVNTQTFPSVSTSGVYQVKIGSSGTPEDNPVLDETTAGQVVPTYNEATRTISAPNGQYLGYLWYRTESCAVANPAPGCDPVILPSSTEWTPATSTEHGSIVLYGMYETFLVLTASNESTINLAPSTPSDTAMDIIGAATNNATGYTLIFQAGCAYDATGDLGAGTCTSDNRLKRVGSALGSLDTTDYLAPTGSGSLTTDSWGYQFDITSPANSGWSPVPTTATTLKTTSSASAGSSPLSAGTPDESNVFYGVKIAPERSPGTYQGTVVWTVIANL